MVERLVYTEKAGGSIPPPPTMAEIKEFKPSTKERPKPEKPARVIGDVETARKKKKVYEMRGDAGSVLADALELIREGHLTDAEVDEIITISEDNKTLLKLISGLFKRLRNKDESIEELRGLIGQLKKRLGEE